jgi:glycosyl transferase, family 25
LGNLGGVDNYFSYKVCINLDRRPDRWEEMRGKFARLNIVTVERLPAVDGKTITVPKHLGHLRAPDYACTLSHLSAVKRASAMGASNVLIFEDDAFFDPAFTVKFPQYIGQLPTDWHMLYLGGYHFQRPIPVSANIVRAVETLTTHAYAVRNSLYGEFIRLNEEPPSIIDRNNTTLQGSFNCYCVEPNLVGQEAGYSDVMDEVMPKKPLVYPFPITGQW